MMTRRRTLRAAAALAGASILGGRAQAGGAAETAKAAGFRMPLESGPHLRTFMQWPADKAIYGSQDALDDVREKIALIANTIGRFEPVVLLTRPEQMAGAGAAIKAGVFGGSTKN